MKLAEIVDLPLSEVLEKLELKRFVPITDDEGNIKRIELVYTPPKSTTAGDSRSDLFRNQRRKDKTNGT